MKKILIKITLILTAAVLVFITALSSWLIYAEIKQNNSETLIYINADKNNSFDYIYIEYDFNQYTQQEIKAIIDEEFNNPFYFYSEIDLNGDLHGYCNILFRQIILEPDLANAEYAFCLTHELIHLTTYTTNELMTQYLTFIKLYESDNELLYYTALYMINMHVLNWFNNEYNVEYYIVNYLEKGVYNEI